MNNLIRVNKRLIPLEHIALVEPYVPDANSPLRTTKVFRSRIVLLDKDSVLSEDATDEFAERHSFRMIAPDGVGTNPEVAYWVEVFEPDETFRPEKPFRTRLLWREATGLAHSKLLLTAPEVALSIAVRGDQPAAAETVEPGPPRPRRRRNADSRAAPKN